MPASESPERGLGESWANLSNSDFNSDDDFRSEHTETTDSASLVPTDVSEDNEDPEDNAAGSQAQLGTALSQRATEDTTLESPSLHPEEAQMEDSAATSITTARQDLPQLVMPAVRDIPAEEVIEFAEPEQWPEEGQVDLKHTVKVFSETERVFLPFMPPTSSATQVIGTLRMTMSKASLRRDQPFRLLYCGHPDATQARKDILEKFGDILVANADHSAGHVESSRYQVIPTVFGPGSSPQSDLMQLRFQQMIVDECVDARRMIGFHEVYRGVDVTMAPIQLRYKNGNEVRSEWDKDENHFRAPRIRGELWDPPDVAIIFVRQDDTAGALRCRQYVQEFMSRHDIPTLVIREDGAWSTHFENVSFDQQSLHMCVESRPVTSFDPGRIFKRLPIDLTSFCNLDAEQLHKHLACLIDTSNSRGLTVTTQPYHYSSMSDSTAQKDAVDVAKKVENSIAHHVKWFSDILLRRGISQPTQVRVFQGILAFMAVSMFLHLAMFAMHFFHPLTAQTVQSSTSYHSSASPVGAHPLTQISSSSLASTASNSAKVQALSSVSSIFAASASLASMPPGIGLPNRHHDQSNSLAVVSGNTDLARLFTTAGLETVNKSDSFLVEVIGDCHVIVKVPQKIMRKRKSPSLTVRVLRDDVELKSNLSHLFDGVYTVRIERDDAYGPLTVVVCTTKSLVTETFQVDFGNSWWSQAKRLLTSPSWNEAAIQSRVISARARVLDGVQNVLGKSLQDARHYLKVLYQPFSDRAKRAVSRSTSLQEYRKQVMKQIWAKNELSKRDIKRVMIDLSTKVREERGRVVKSATGMASNVQRQLHHLRDRISRADVRKWKLQVQDRTRSDSLATAQERAKQIVDDAIKSAKEFRQNSGRQGRFRKDKSGHKMRWHGNVRVRP